jgi:hypothetical protein
MGIEAARIFISEDTILINDKIRRKLYYGSPACLSAKYGISASALPLLTGDFIDNKERMKERISCDGGTSRFYGDIENKEVDYILNCRNGKLKSSDLRKESEAEGILFSFDKFMKIDGKVFPGIIIIEDYKKETVIRVQIERINFEKGDAIEFIPGNNYEKVELK